MGQVTITQDRRSQLIAAVTKFFRDQVNNGSNMPEELSLEIYNFIMAPFIPALRNLPPQLVHTTAEATFTFKTGTFQSDLTAKFGSHMAFFRSCRDAHAVRPELFEQGHYYSGTYQLKANSNAWGEELYNKLVTTFQTYNEASLTHQKVRDNLTTLLDQNRTLRQAIKAWPTLRHFCVPSDLEAIKSEPKARVGNAFNVDLTYLTTMAAVARISR
jgi:hypothetical protein